MASDYKFCVVPQKDAGVSKLVGSLNINILNDLQILFLRINPLDSFILL
jgi:hypothetical protein